MPTRRQGAAGTVGAVDIWLVAALAAWLPVAAALALLVGRSVTHADVVAGTRPERPAPERRSVAPRATAGSPLVAQRVRS